jgi:hypothetical protein
MEAKVLTAKERDCAAAIKMMSGIAGATVVTHTRPAWERNVWARTQVMSVGVFVEATGNKPLPAETIGAIGQVVKSTFGITDMKEINIADTIHSRSYDGSGEEVGQTTMGVRESLHCPHPNPLPEGEGTMDWTLPEGEGTMDWTLPEGEGTVDGPSRGKGTMDGPFQRGRTAIYSNS